MKAIIPNKINYKNTINSLSSPCSDEGIKREIYSLNKKLNRKVIVLDDDPTGTQTVHDLIVLTNWDKEDLRKAFDESSFIFYILTNTRSYEPEKAERMNREIIMNISSVAKETDQSFVIISRGDSTLRGHYPLEIDVAVEELQKDSRARIDGHLIIPAFFEGKRYTYNDVHYIKENDQLIPVNDSEFAHDKAFGFTKGNLIEWVEEKTDGRIQQSQCESISVEQLRTDPDSVLNVLLTATNNQPIIVNALCYEDLDVLSLALLRAEIKGKRFIYRTAASFVKSFAGINNKPYLQKEQMIMKGNEKKGGIVIVGSHVKKTTSQLNRLLECGPVEALEINVKQLLDSDHSEDEISRINQKLNTFIQKGYTTVLYTSRELISVNEKKDNLIISQKVSKALTEIVRSLESAPKFIIAKGGITSSDIATKGLDIKVARILGQAASGIPVWLTGEESKFSNMPYIVFPGNVGDEDTLLEVVNKLM